MGVGGGRAGGAPPFSFLITTIIITVNIVNDAIPSIILMMR